VGIPFPRLVLHVAAATQESFDDSGTRTTGELGIDPQASVSA